LFYFCHYIIKIFFEARYVVFYLVTTGQSHSMKSEWSNWWGMVMCKLIRFCQFQKMRLVTTGVQFMGVANFIGFTLSQNAQTALYRENNM
jgi:hypothetical protein